MKPRPNLPAPRHILAVFAGGMAGAAARYGILAGYPNTPGEFPRTTFVENIAGAFLLGLLLTVVLRGWRWRFEPRPLLATGMLGAFTTFSTFAVEIANLIDDGYPGISIAYAVASLVVGLLAALLGIRLGQMAPRRVAV